MVKGLAAAVLGLAIGTMGIDPLSGQARFTFGQPWLLSGIDLIVALVGLYALPPLLELAEKADLKGMSRDKLNLRPVKLGWGIFRDHGRTWVRSSLIGIGVGILPGAGGNVAAFLSYGAAKNASKDPDSFGKGNPDGVAAAECGNNADNAAAMIPALTLGIPGNVIAALVLGALMIQGIQPGPALFRENSNLVFGFGIELFVTSALLFVVGGLAATRIFAQVQRLPGVVMVPMILVLMTVGVFVINGRTTDLWVMFGFGLAGYVFEKIKIPLVPIVLGLILGPLAEQSVRRTLLISRGDWTAIFTSPISTGIALATLAVIVFPIFRRHQSRLLATKT